MSERAARWAAGVVIAAALAWGADRFLDTFVQMRDDIRDIKCWIEQQSGGDCM